MHVPDPDAMAHLLLSMVGEAALFVAHAANRLAARTQVGAATGALLSGLAANERGRTGRPNYS